MVFSIDRNSSFIPPPLLLHNDEGTVKIVDHRGSSKPDLIAIAGLDDFLISGDRTGFTSFHGFNNITGIHNAATRLIEDTKPIEHIFLRRDTYSWC
jgi:hypothetical protein